MESTVDKLKQLVKDNQTPLMIAGAVAGTAALGYYGVKKAFATHHKPSHGWGNEATGGVGV